MIYTVTLNPVLDRTISVPEIILNQVLRATSVRLDLGGKGLNVSRALNALGATSVAMGFIGGATGVYLEQGLGELSIPTDFVHIQGDTRTNTVIIDKDAERHIKVNEPGPTIRPVEQAALIDKIYNKTQPDDYWAFCGSLPPSVESDYYARLITMVQSKGARAILDASGEALRIGCKAAPYLVKPNAIEAEEATGISVRGEGEAYRATLVLLVQGIKLVALSMGSEGLLLAAQECAVHVKPPRVPVKNTVGAGDATLAGLIWSLSQGLSLETTACWGVAAGTAAAMQDGVCVGTRSEVETLFKQISTGSFPYLIDSSIDGVESSDPNQ